MGQGQAAGSCIFFTDELQLCAVLQAHPFHGNHDGLKARTFCPDTNGFAGSGKFDSQPRGGQRCKMGSFGTLVGHLL
jgi:hypothetical protein